MNKYPEHEKLDKVKDKSQILGEFLEWLNEQGMFICELDTGSYENSWIITDHSLEELIAKFFSIDLNKIEKEKRKMLEEIRLTNSKK